MAGNENSGRRPLRPTDARLPRPGNTEKSIRRYISAVLYGVGNDLIDPRRGDTLIAGAKAALQSLRQEHGRTEIEELRALVDQAKAALQSARKRVSDERDKLTHAEVGEDGAQARAPQATPTE